MVEKYRWDNAREWLDNKRSLRELSDREILNAFIDLIDCDQIQDVFQAEMDADGYFAEED